MPFDAIPAFVTSAKTSLSNRFGLRRKQCLDHFMSITSDSVLLAIQTSDNMLRGGAVERTTTFGFSGTRAIFVLGLS
jgi:hypothetical protein